MCKILNIKVSLGYLCFMPLKHTVFQKGTWCCCSDRKKSALLSQEFVAYSSHVNKHLQCTENPSGTTRVLMRRGRGRGKNICARWFPYSVMRQAQHTGSELVSVNTFMELQDVEVCSSCLLLDSREVRREYKNP